MLRVGKFGVRRPRTGDSLGPMHLSWLDPGQLSDRDVAGAVAVLEAARQVDCPHQLGPTTATFMADVRHGPDGDPSAIAVVSGVPDPRHDDPVADEGNAAGAVTGVLEVVLPHRDNTHMAIVRVTVHPAVRRRGLGARLFAAGVDLARRRDRTLVLAGCWDRTPGVAFATAMGMDRATQEAKRVQDVLTVGVARLRLLASGAREHAGGYELIPIFGRTPAEMLAGVATMVGAINDAPIDELDVEDMVFTPERVQAFEGAQLAHDRRLYRLIAREQATGEFAGHTHVGVDAQRPWHATQYDTSVVRAHRGHRLGLLLKAEMLNWLREAEPQLERLETWNASSNAQMIAVNDMLGYRVVAQVAGWQRHV